LELMVVTLCVRLADEQRKDFAHQLPVELQDIALGVRMTESDTRKNLLKQFMDLQKISEHHAKQQITAAWHALRDAVNVKRLDHIKAELPPRTATLLK
jgi:uncharacterized protein (DUF2267 family)